MKSVFIQLRWLLCACLMLSALSALADTPPPPPPPTFSVPPDWPSEFRRPHNPEDMRRWREHEALPSGGRLHRRMSPQERDLLRHDLDRARREIYRDRHAPWVPMSPPPASQPDGPRRAPPSDD